MTMQGRATPPGGGPAWSPARPVPAAPAPAASAALTSSSTSMVWCTVRVRGPQGAVDVALPAGGTVAEVLEELAGRLLPGAPLGRPGDTWHLHRLGRPPFHPQTRLADTGVADGESLHLSAHPMPRPAQPVDDGLVALAEGVGRVGRWSPRAVTRFAATLAVIAAAGATALGLTLPLGPTVPVVLALALLGAAVGLRPGTGGGAGTRPGRADAGDDLPTLGAALASLPAWAGAGLGIVGLTGGGPATSLAYASSATTIGAVLAALVLPRRMPWWSAVLAGSITLTLAALAVGLDLLVAPRAAAVVATLWLAGLLVLPWFAVRRQGWLSPDTLDEDVLLARAAGTRRIIDAIALAASLVIAVCALVLAATAAPLAVGFVGAVSVAVVLRARRTVFVVESAAEVGAGVVGLAAVLSALAVGAGLGVRAGLVIGTAAVLALVVALGVSARRRAAGDDTALAWWSRPRTRRTLTIVEGIAAVAVLPLLLGVLGVYSIAANAGASL